MNEFPRIVLAILALTLATSASAQMYKCTSAAGKVTYSSSPCSSLGLKDAGEVRDQLNTSPAQRVVPFNSPPPAGTAPAASATGGSGAAAKPAPDERRCFKTAKGMRCNDDPPENDPVPLDAKSRGETKAGN